MDYLFFGKNSCKEVYLLSKHSKQNDNLQLVPLGGVGEIGKNMFTLKYRQECIVLDAGLKFPEEGMHGVDIVIPDKTYLLENQELIKGIILTHGHEDHIGALPYLAKDLSVPVYGTKLTLGMLQSKMTDHESLRDIEMREINPDQILDISPSFKLEFFSQRTIQCQFWNQADGTIRINDGFK